ncbi:DUF397 domain-containing protein [Streptomyces palmae]|uniref:DUF397 domain-containing protein n=1 Tax=Streptomyces palmae TaxID=1701085 RepID=A0A4Z0H9H4_9ACTN|nr:DUF397 domain-containing protein [Streptomyces palmae]TGB11181.1 DUF397 domain-containing protein [Streptomyces palmae]
MHELNWQKSSFSEPGGADCVELASSTTGIHLRESDDPEVVLTTTPRALRVLLDSIRLGRFDHIR